MPESFYTVYEESSLMVTTIVGNMDGKSLTDLFREETSDPRGPGLQKHLVDLRLADGTGPSMEVIRSLAWSTRAFLTRHHIRTHQTAIVAIRDIDYGYARMFASFAEWTPCQVSVFRRMRDAGEWLGVEVEALIDSQLAEAGLGAANIAG